MIIKNDVAIFDNFVSPSDCKEIIQTFSNKPGITRQQLGSSPIEKSDTSVYFSTNEYFNELPLVVNNFYNKFWGDAWVQYTNKYFILTAGGSSRYAINGIKYQNTKPGEGYHVWHHENGNMELLSRVMFFILYLNDDFEGGETEMLYQNSRIQPKTGRLILSPGHYTHTHRGNPPLNNEKHILTGWIHRLA